MTDEALMRLEALCDASDKAANSASPGAVLTTQETTYIKAAITALPAALAEIRRLRDEETRRSRRIIDFCAQAGPILGFEGSDWHNVNFDRVLEGVKRLTEEHAQMKALAGEAIREWSTADQGLWAEVSGGIYRNGTLVEFRDRLVALGGPRVELVGNPEPDAEAPRCHKHVWLPERRPPPVVGYVSQDGSPRPPGVVKVPCGEPFAHDGPCRPFPGVQLDISKGPLDE